MPTDTRNDRARPPRTAAWAETPSAWEVPGLLARVVFFAAAPFAFVIVCVMLNQTFLLALMVVTILLTGVLGNPTGWLERYPLLERVPLVGGSLKQLARIQECYRESRPRSFLFYLFYPVTCPLLLPFSAGVRREFLLYGGLLGTLAVALLLDAAFSYPATYPPHLGPREAAVILTVQLVFSFASVVGFVIPVTTTSFAYHLSGRQGWLRCLALLAVVSAGLGLAGHLGRRQAPLSLVSSQLLAERMKQPGFRAELRESLEMFLGYHARGPERQDATVPVSDPVLTRKLQRCVAALAVGSEARAFTAFRVGAGGAGDPPGPAWLGVRVRYYNSRTHPPRVLALVSPEGVFHGRWGELPPALQERFTVVAKPGGAGWEPTPGQVGVAALLDDAP